MEILLVCFNIALTLFLIVETYFSLFWRMVHDSPILFYMGFLIARHNAIPYKDIFDMNMPGAHWIYALCGRLFGFSDRGFQVANLLFLFIICVLIFFWLRSFNTLTAWTGSLLFGLLYLHYGPAMSMQREFLTLPFLLAGFLFYSMGNKRFLLRLFLAAFSIGISVLIKPQSGIIILIFLLLEFRQSKNLLKPINKSFLLKMTAISLGFVIPLLLAGVYIQVNNALASFLEIAVKYWPLYNAINARLEINTNTSKLVEIFNGIKSIGWYGLWIIPAAISIFLIFKRNKPDNRNRQKVLIMVYGSVFSLVEVIIANKYWDYHWLPLIFFLIMLSTTGLTGLIHQSRSFLAWCVPAGIIIAFLFTCLPQGFPENPNWYIQQPPQISRIDSIAKYLRDNLEPGDTVQPLDWSNGAVNAMLIARAQPATRYLYDFYFYHHVSNPEIQNMRSDFLKNLNIAKPKIIIQFFSDRPWVDGPDTTRDFPDLTSYLNQNYYVDVEKDGYRLWMRQ